MPGFARDSVVGYVGVVLQIVTPGAAMPTYGLTLLKLGCWSAVSVAATARLSAYAPGYCGALTAAQRVEVTPQFPAAATTSTLCASA